MKICLPISQPNYSFGTKYWFPSHTVKPILKQHFIPEFHCQNEIKEIKDDRQRQTRYQRGIYI